MSAVTTRQPKPELVIRRVFDAPRALVFRMWTEAEHLRCWCCPKGFSIPSHEGDIRKGGWYRSCMRSPEGEDHWVSGTYREIVENERIVFTHAWQDEAGNPGHETVVTITLRDAVGGGTALTLHQAFFTSEASRDGHMEGWNETLDSLAEYLV